jgi:hypothetical protein
LSRSHENHGGHEESLYETLIVSFVSFVPS